MSSSHPSSKVSATTTTPSAGVMIIGDEILSGQTQDANLHFLATKLMDLGIKLCEARVVSDNVATIVDAVKHFSHSFEYVFTTGGIGTTHDDVTAEAMAKAFDRELLRHPEAEQRLRAHYGEHITEARLRMAMIPEGATLIDNPASAAPGFRIENVFVLAGVPSIASAMFATLEPQLHHGPPIYVVSVRGDAPESEIADDLRNLQNQFPDVSIGSYPFFKLGGYGVALVARSVDFARLDHVREKLEVLMRAHGRANGREEREPSTEWLRRPDGDQPGTTNKDLN